MLPSPVLLNSAAWRQRWFQKITDRTRPATPMPNESPQAAPQPPDLFADCKTEKHATLKAEGVFQPVLSCPSCNTAEHVFDDRKQGQTVCKGCGLVLKETLVNWEPEIEWDAHKDKEDLARMKQSMADNDRQCKPWMPVLQTRVDNGARARGGYGNIAQAHTALEAKELSIEDLLYAHSGAYDAERLAMLARRTAELKLWLTVQHMDAEKAQKRREYLPEWLNRHNHPKPKPEEIPQLQLELDVLLAARNMTPMEIETKIASVQRAVEFLSASQAEQGMTPEKKQQLHTEITLRRFAKSAKHLHHVVEALFDSVPLQLLSVAQEYLKQFVGLHDRRLNSRDTWACCCIQLAAMYNFQFMLNERALRAYCSQPCKLKTLRKDIRIVRKALKLPELSPVTLVQLNRTRIQKPFAGLGRGRMGERNIEVLFTEHPLAAEEESKLDVLFAVVLELLYAFNVPKPEPFKRKLPDADAAAADNEEDGDESSDPDEADDISNEPQQQAERQNSMLQSLASAVGSKRPRSASGESEASVDMPADKKRQGSSSNSKAMPRLSTVTQEQESQTDARAVWDFMKPVLALLTKLQKSDGKQQVLNLTEAATAWPDAIKKQVLMSLQRRAPRTVASALFYLGVQSMRSVSMRITMDTVRIVAYVGAIPLRDCKAQLRDLMAFVLRQSNSNELLAAALAPYVAASNTKAANSSNSSNSRANMDISAPRAQQMKPDMFLLCP